MELKKILPKLILAGIGLFVLFFFISTYYISRTVKTDCKTIQKESHLSCVDALISRLSNEKIDLATRNRYIWMLGQIGDPKALPILKTYYEGGGKQCNHDEELCQYEMEKAINLIEKQNNIVKKIWGY